MLRSNTAASTDLKEHSTLDLSNDEKIPSTLTIDPSANSKTDQDPPRRATTAMLREVFSLVGCNTVEEDEDQDLSKQSICRRITPPIVETSVALAYAGATTAFFERGKSWMDYVFHPFIIAAVIVGPNLGLRGVDNYYPEFRNILTLIRSVLFSLLSLATEDPLIHESGHAISSYALFKNPQPNITIQPFGAGLTEVFTGELSDWGKSQGMSKAQGLLAASGTGSALLWDYAALIAAQIIPNPEIKMYLRLTVMASVISHTVYALSASWGCKPGHDFCTLDDKGVSPFLAAAFIAGTALLLQIILSTTSYGYKKVAACYNKNKENDLEKDPDIEKDKVKDPDNDQARDKANDLSLSKEIEPNEPSGISMTR
jgi:hypothetical protein